MIVAAILARASIQEAATPDLADSARALIDRSLGDPRIDPSRELPMIGAFAYTRMGYYDEVVERLTEVIAANPILATGLTTSDYWWWRDLMDHPGFLELGLMATGEAR
jgi:hypothetical protein